MREISTKPIEVGEHVMIDGVEYVAEKPDIEDVCKGCAFHHVNVECSEFIECHGIIFKKVQKEPKYRPYKDTEEMITDWIERFGTYDTKVVMPPIWIWDKDKVEKTLITGFRRQEVNTTDAIIGMASLLQSYTYLDGSPCGKEVTE